MCALLFDPICIFQLTPNTRCYDTSNSSETSVTTHLIRGVSQSDDQYAYTDMDGNIFIWGSKESRLQLNEKHMEQTPRSFPIISKDGQLYDWYAFFNHFILYEKCKHFSN